MADQKSDIEKYIRGEMTPDEMHALEKKALNDPFLADALEGAGSVGSRDFSDDLAEIDKRIAAGQKVGKGWFRPLRIAATLLFLMVASAIIYWVVNPEEPVTLAQQKIEDSATEEKKTEVLADQPKAQPKPEEMTSEKSAGAERARDEAFARAREDAELSAKAKKEEGLVAKEIESLPNSAAEVKRPAKEREQARPSEAGPPVTAQVEENSGKAGIAAAGKSKDDNKKEKLVTAEAPAGHAVSDKSKSDNDLALSRKNAPTQLTTAGRAAVPVAQMVVRGRVTQAEDGTPLPGASIIAKGTHDGTASNIDGEYNLTLGTKQDTLVISFIGFETKTLAIKNVSTPVDVALASDPVQLSEVVVTSYENKLNDGENDEVITLAEPAGGIRAYHQYLKKSLRYPEAALASKIEGKVGLEFIVTSNGDLTDLRITRSLGYGCDEEVIRLVKEGPGWEPSFLGSKKLGSKVRVKLKFKLPR